MKTEPDLDAADGVKQLLYVSSERVADLVRSAAGGTEFFVQIFMGEYKDLVALTNFGRLYRKAGADKWIEIAVPDFGGIPEK